INATIPRYEEKSDDGDKHNILLAYIKINENI
ncbi:hypothetical protein AAUPMC_06417, partial [Pasteurella multocida subsp. multocida str. Anand1_cattle]